MTDFNNYINSINIGEDFDGIFYAMVTGFNPISTDMPSWWNPRSTSFNPKVPVDRLNPNSEGQIWAFTVFHDDGKYKMLPSFCRNPETGEWEDHIDCDQIIRADGTQLWIYHDYELDGKITLRRVENPNR
jgi:hypothetical protein